MGTNSVDISSKFKLKKECKHFFVKEEPKKGENREMKTESFFHRSLDTVIVLQIL